MKFLNWIFGGGRNAVASTLGVFMENSEAGAQRRADYSQATLAQYAAEFQAPRLGIFDRFVDGLNRLPRPLMVFAILGLFTMAMVDPIWFAARMQGLVLVPDPLWWLAGTIVAFYFGGRFQIKSQQFHQSLVDTTAMVPQVLENIQKVQALRHDRPGIADTGTDVGLARMATETHDNPAVAAWKNGGSK